MAVSQPSKSLAEQLAAPAAASSMRAPKLALEVPVPAELRAELAVDAAQRLAGALRPPAEWVAAVVGETSMRFVAVWGPTKQPERKQLEQKLLVQWLTGLGLEAAAVQTAVADAGQTVWRADPLATLRAFEESPTAPSRRRGS